jgi:Tol biopolymer transport system component
MLRTAASKVMWVGRSTGFYALVVAVLLALVLIVAVVAATNPAKAAFPGHNGKIAFESLRDGNWEIYSMNSDGTSQQNLTFSWEYDRSPAWSPNGRKIAFDCGQEICTMNSDGTHLTRLTFNAAYDEFPAWSPNGKQIAFDSNRDSATYEIYKMNSDGTHLTRLTFNTGVDSRPSWQPLP